MLLAHPGKVAIATENLLSLVFCPPACPILIQLNYTGLPVSAASQTSSCPGVFALLLSVDTPYPAKALCIPYVRCLLNPLSEPRFPTPRILVLSVPTLMFVLPHMESASS